MFDVRCSSFICSQGVDSSLKYVESEFTPGQKPRNYLVHPVILSKNKLEVGYGG
jgi:hypothetical protein